MTTDRKLSHKKTLPFNRFLFGSPYYPEHWNAHERENDPALMQAAGWNCIRMAEFAWDLMEPEPGRYNFSLFDETIARMGKKGISTILCTPTATPPRWLTARHPEICRVDANGVVQQHGSRQHACHAGAIFREYSRSITRAMADHFRDNPFVIGWQTDNEFHCHFSECHCENCRQEFVVFLKHKYDNDIRALNNAWGTVFWAQTYPDFESIPTPKPKAPAPPNPAHVLDYNRFLSWAVTGFQHDQVEILRAAQPAWFVTHNGFFPHIDYRGDFTQDLDFLGYDIYPYFDFDPQHRPYSQAFNMDHARGWSGNVFMLEHQSGPGGQGPYFHDTPEPGEMRRMAYTSLARGSDSLLFFRWRTCRFGAEEYWCGILNHDNVPRRRYREAKDLGAELKTIGPELLGTHVHIDVGIAANDVDVYDAHAPLSMGLPSPKEMAETVHGVFFEQGYAAGCVHPADDLSGLKLYIIPHWALFDPAWLPNLTQFVEQGGTLVIGARTATKDVNNNVVSEVLPGVLRALAGVTVEEYGRQNAPHRRPLTVKIGEAHVVSELWYEALQPDEGTGVLAHWQGRHPDGAAAITVCRHGTGRVVYVGTYLTAGLCAALLPELAQSTNLHPLWPVPEHVEVVRRQDGEKKLWFFINHTDDSIIIEEVPGGENLITGEMTAGPLRLNRYGVAVIKEICR